MKSSIFYTDAYNDIETSVQKLLNSHEEFLSSSTARSTRAVGDAIEAILGDSFETILGDLCKEYSATFARRAMADLAFTDVDDLYYIVDVKTHRTDTKFNMPNLTSVRRLARFYEDDANYFILLIASYHLEATQAIVTNVRFAPIEFLDGAVSPSAHLDGDRFRSQIQTISLSTPNTRVRNGCSNYVMFSSSSIRKKSPR